MAIVKSVSFVVDVKGSSTGQQFKGVFEAKPRLSMADRLSKDAIRRNLLGSGKPEECGAAATSVAVIISELQTRLTKVPDWWTSSSNGLELSDENVLVEIYENSLRVEREALDALISSADKEAAALKAVKPE